MLINYKVNMPLRHNYWNVSSPKMLSSSVHWIFVEIRGKVEESVFLKAGTRRKHNKKANWLVFAYVTREIVFTCGCHKNQKSIKSQLFPKNQTWKKHNRPEAKIIISFVKKRKRFRKMFLLKEASAHMFINSFYYSCLSISPKM